MSRFGYQERVSTQAVAPDCIQATGVALQALGGQPQLVGATVTCKLGRRIGTRLVGGAFVPERWLPVLVTVQVADTGWSRELLITVAENMGFGWLVGMEGRLKTQCQVTAGQLKQSIEQQLAARVPVAGPVR